MRGEGESLFSSTLGIERGEIEKRSLSSAVQQMPLAAAVESAGERRRRESETRKAEEGRELELCLHEEEEE